MRYLSASFVLAILVGCNNRVSVIDPLDGATVSPHTDGGVPSAEPTGLAPCAPSAARWEQATVEIPSGVAESSCEWKSTTWLDKLTGEEVQIEIVTKEGAVATVNRYALNGTWQSSKAYTVDSQNRWTFYEYRSNDIVGTLGYQRSFDEQGRLVSYSNVNGDYSSKMTQQYDAAGNLSARNTTDSIGWNVTVSWTYDEPGRLLTAVRTASKAGATGQEDRLEWAYDNWGRPLKVLRVRDGAIIAKIAWRWQEGKNLPVSRTTSLYAGMNRDQSVPALDDFGTLTWASLNKEYKFSGYEPKSQSELCRPVSVGMSEGYEEEAYSIGIDPYRQPYPSIVRKYLPYFPPQAMAYGYQRIFSPEGTAPSAFMHVPHRYRLLTLIAPATESEITYDQKGRAVEERGATIRNDAGDEEEIYRRTRAYTDEDLVSDELIFSAWQTQLALTRKLAFEYDEKGRCTKRSLLDGAGHPIAYQTTQFGKGNGSSDEYPIVQTTFAEDRFFKGSDGEPQEPTELGLLQWGIASEFGYHYEYALLNDGSHHWDSQILFSNSGTVSHFITDATPNDWWQSRREFDESQRLIRQGSFHIDAPDFLWKEDYQYNDAGALLDKESISHDQHQNVISHTLETNALLCN
jgi:YD repeat-containing protein